MHTHTQQQEQHKKLWNVNRSRLNIGTEWCCHLLTKITSSILSSEVLLWDLNKIKNRKLKIWKSISVDVTGINLEVNISSLYFFLNDNALY